MYPPHQPPKKYPSLLWGSALQGHPEVRHCRERLEHCREPIGAIFGLYWGYIAVILGLSWGYMGIMEKKMEATIMGYIGFRV